jgi:hypothetical protein
VGGHPQGFAHGEDAHRNDDHINAIGELRDAHRQPLLARDEVDAHDPDAQPH